MVRMAALAVLVLAGAPAAKPSPSVSPAPSPSPTPTPVPTPSLDDSISFLREKLTTYGSYSFEIAVADDPSEKGKLSGANTVSSFDKTDCVLNLTRKLDWGTSAGDPETDYRETSTITLRVPLREMKPKVKLGPVPDTFRKMFSVTGAESLTQIELSAKSDRKPIGVKDSRSVTAEGKTTRENVNDNIASTYIVFADGDIARRAADAVEQALKLCQQKKEKF